MSDIIFLFVFRHKTEKRRKNMKLTKCAAVMAAALMLTGCGKSLSFISGEDAPAGTEAPVIITLHPDKAPITCENFESLISEGFYNGLTFHRVIDGFMAQGGDPSGNGTGSSQKTIKGEFSSNGVNNDLKHKRGTVSMARTDDKDGASCQFFICYADRPDLDGSYAAFGEVTEGMEVIDKFLEVNRTYAANGEKSVPVRPIVIDSAEMTDPDSNGDPRVKLVMRTIPVGEQ